MDTFIVKTLKTERSRNQYAARVLQRTFCVTMIALLGACSAVQPVAYDPPTDRGFEPGTVFEANRVLQNANGLSMGLLAGPEDVAFGPDGWVYAGFHDGSFGGGGVLRMRPDGSEREVFVATDAWVTGIEFDAADNLIALVQNLGIVSIAPDRTVTTVATELDGEPFLIPNDLDIGPNGHIFFTVSSTTVPSSPANALNLIMGARRDDGGLFVYNPGAPSPADRVRRLIDGLHFANGVAVDPYGNYVLVVETGRYRVLRYWINGPDAGTTEVFLDNLPGIPNGISARPVAQTDTINDDGRAQFWLGFSTRRNAAIDALHPRPFLKRIMMGLPSALRPSAEPYGLVALVETRTGATGRVVRTLHDPEGKKVREATSVEEANGILYLGGDISDTVWAVALPEVDHR